MQSTLLRRWNRPRPWNSQNTGASQGVARSGRGTLAAPGALDRLCHLDWPLGRVGRKSSARLLAKTDEETRALRGACALPRTEPSSNAAPRLVPHFTVVFWVLLGARPWREGEPRKPKTHKQTGPRGSGEGWTVNEEPTEGMTKITTDGDTGRQRGQKSKEQQVTSRLPIRAQEITGH